jgi:sodium-dependent dicarboxylate transporter 2/3/5
MMLAILAPVLKLFEPADRGKIAFVLGIPFAANVGGIGTPIGTPPNAIALKYLTGENAVGFGQWMSFALPFALVMLFFVWLLLLTFYKPSAATIDIDIKGRFRKNWQAVTVYITFAVTLLFWLFDFLHGMNAYTVAMIPVAVFTATGILSAQDLKRVNWDVLWLVSGGIALGVGLEKTGLAAHIIENIPFASYPAFFVIILVTGLAITMATFMSNTATANLLMPVMTALGTSIASLETLGGVKLLLIAVAMSSSLAMALPISTPPNAMAHATGEIETKHLLKSGLIVGFVGLTGVHLMLLIINNWNLL